MYFLAQVRFADILALRDRLPAVQDKLRHSGFPVFNRAIVKVVNVKIGSQMPEIEDREVWHFNNIDADHGIVLSRDFVTLHSTRYQQFELMLELFQTALEKIHSVAQIDVFQRCGLRYVNAISPAPGQDYGTYLRPGVIGISSIMTDVEPIAQNIMFAGKTNCGTLVVRFVTGASPNIMPPDLVPLTLNLPAVIPAGTPVGTLDLDHFTERQEVFSVEQTLQQLVALHDGCWDAFNSCVTADGLRHWGKRDV